MKRLSGWDAVLLYSETPNVHMHTLKLAVIELGDLGGATFGVEEFRKVIASRLHKLDPFRYRARRYPVASSTIRCGGRTAEVDLEYHVRPCRVDAPGGRRQLDEAVGRIASTPLDRSRRCGRCTSSRAWPTAGSRCSARSTTRWPTASPRPTCWRAAWICNDGPQADDDSYATDPAPTKVAAGAHRVRRPPPADRPRLPAGDAIHRPGSQPGAQESAQAVPGADPPVHPAAVLHEPHASTRKRRFATATLRSPTSRRPASTSASRSTTWCWRYRRVRCASCC